MKLKLIAISSVAALIFGCGPSTKIEKSWTDPSWTAGSVQPFKKVLVMGLMKDAASRRMAEDKMVAAMKVPAVQSYSYLQAGDTLKSEVEAKLKKDGFDGIIVAKLADVEKSTSYVPGTTYGGWYGYRYGSPGYYTEDKTFYVETNIYSLESGKLLWSATTSSLNPSKADKAMDEVIATVKEQMMKQGLIK